MQLPSGSGMSRTYVNFVNRSLCTRLCRYQYAQPVTQKSKTVAPEGEEEKKKSAHVLRNLEARKKGKRYSIAQLSCSD